MCWNRVQSNLTVTHVFLPPFSWLQTFVIHHSPALNDIYIYICALKKDVCQSRSSKWNLGSKVFIFTVAPTTNLITPSRPLQFFNLYYSYIAWAPLSSDSSSHLRLFIPRLIRAYSNRFLNLFEILVSWVYNSNHPKTPPYLSPSPEPFLELRCLLSSWCTPEFLFDLLGHSH